jgi:uncharacterized protein YcbX
MIKITALNVYPVKSCKGVALDVARIGVKGIDHDREWLIARPDGKFVTQRELPRLALIEPQLTDASLRLSAPGMEALEVDSALERNPVDVTCWGDRCRGFDAGVDAERWLDAFLGEPHRLIRFDPAHKRPAKQQWTQGIEALNQFSDGFPFLVISQASLDELNRRLHAPLPMNRFRPNIVIEGVPPFGEDQIHELRSGDVVLRVAKPCTRCAITTTDQTRGARDGDEPLRTLRSFRFSRELKGVLFGQNVILVSGAGAQLQVGQSLEATMSSSPPVRLES